MSSTSRSPHPGDCSVPVHVAIIMDGNGRWAREKGLPRHEGHRAGMKAVREAVEGAVESGVEILTLFAFSTENWQRPPDEISALMTLLQLYAEREGSELKEKGVEVRVLGERSRLAPGARAAVERIEDSTRGGEALQLNLMISYSGRAEIVRAVRTLARRVASGELDPDEVEASHVEGALYTTGLPDPDLLIRSSGELRLSNFMLWQLAYTEIHIAPVLWPDFTRKDFQRAVQEFDSRERRFGRVVSST
ncbi:MAG: di-trans,poly-cis-decaprenylcistransferase [Gemmatimonadales bacterium]|nr:MAG: di-trans,poly-cis-decaprenylcistransferase [Gemmatimonadales bacterium]